MLGHVEEKGRRMPIFDYIADVSPRSQHKGKHLNVGKSPYLAQLRCSGVYSAYNFVVQSNFYNLLDHRHLHHVQHDCSPSNVLRGLRGDQPTSPKYHHIVIKRYRDNDFTKILQLTKGVTIVSELYYHHTTKFVSSCFKYENFVKTLSPSISINMFILYNVNK